MTTAFEQVSGAINDLRSVVQGIDKSKTARPVDAETLRKVQRTLVKLRRSHAQLRDAQSSEQKQIIQAVKKLNSAKMVCLSHSPASYFH